MPAVSQKQQRFMAMAEHNPSKLREPAPNMTHAQLHDFAATPRTGLPRQANPLSGLQRAAKLRAGSY
jgi:hypothetical protein